MRSEDLALNLIALADPEVPIGFIETALRTDRVEGIDTSPVWYIKG
jgi:hypothetical protein|tara:strand:- start:116 stop:253 length:138 start_codon:yes stop_codon:yes gene_type:complete